MILWNHKKDDLTGTFKGTIKALPYSFNGEAFVLVLALLLVLILLALRGEKPSCVRPSQFGLLCTFNWLWGSYDLKVGQVGEQVDSINLFSISKQDGESLTIRMVRERSPFRSSFGIFTPRRWSLCNANSLAKKIKGNRLLALSSSWPVDLEDFGMTHDPQTGLWRISIRDQKLRFQLVTNTMLQQLAWINVSIFFQKTF